MQTLKKMIDDLVEYFGNNKNSFINTEKKKWLDEFDIKTDRCDASEYSAETNSQIRAAVKEKEDMKASIERMINIRKKGRIDFYIDEHNRCESTEFVLENKKENLQNIANEEI